ALIQSPLSQLIKLSDCVLLRIGKRWREPKQDDRDRSENHFQETHRCAVLTACLRSTGESRRAKLARDASSAIKGVTNVPSQLRQRPVAQVNRNRALAHRRGYALHVPGSNVTDREHRGEGGLQKLRRTQQRPAVSHQR